MARLFEPFFSTKSSETGTGLGLTIVQRIVSQHDGLIDVRSLPGEGSSFRVYLPLSAEKPERDGGASPTALPARGSGRVLVIDDEQSICDVIKSILREGGYDPVVTTSPKKGIEIYEREWLNIRLVILDMSMPELSGLEELRRISGIHPGIPVLIISGFPHDERIERALEMGAAGFLGKPFSAETLLNKVLSLTRN
jgi:two-component system, cell cycle sensor histidine kinase and response regulator CckA